MSTPDQDPNLALEDEQLREAAGQREFIEQSIEDGGLWHNMKAVAGYLYDRKLAIGSALTATITAIGVADAARAFARGNWRVVEDTTFQAEKNYIGPQQAIAYLNAQRRQNGIPSDLTNYAPYTQGCWDYTNMYVFKAGQATQGEVPGQPGYTKLGNSAALDSSVGGNEELWTDDTNGNPFADAPIHESLEFDPQANVAWYGQREHIDSNVDPGACIGTSVATGGTYEPSQQAFYSVPGNGVKDVRPSLVEHDSPSTPAEDVGLPANKLTGPAIMLWDEMPNPDQDGGSPVVQSATLKGPTGDVAVRPLNGENGSLHLSPSKIGPDSPNFVQVVNPLRPNTTYELVANWQGTGYSAEQDVTFTTESAQEASNQNTPQCSDCSEGHIFVGAEGHNVHVSVDPAAGEKVTVTYIYGVPICSVNRSPCPKSEQGYSTRVSGTKTFLDHGPKVIKLPAEPAGDSGSSVTVSIPNSFKASGDTWPQMLGSAQYVKDPSWAHCSSARTGLGAFGGYVC